MMPVLRWVRQHIAMLLLIASPAVGGQLLPLVHPCPVESPWVAGPEAADPHAAHGHADHGTPSPSEQHAHADCTCIGACAAPIALNAPQPHVVSRVAYAATLLQPSWVPVERIGAPLRPHDRLPPQTAPPLA